MLIMRTYFFSFILLINIFAAASPIPATSSSQFISSHLGTFYSPLGFKISAAGTTWLHTQPKSNPYVITEYRAPDLQNGVQPALTLRVNHLPKKTTLKKYIKSWVKDYSKFGLKILTSKPITVNKRLAYLVDSVNSNSQRQMRQLIFLKDKVAVVMTCRSHVNSFKSNIESCHKIFRNFRWTL